MLSVGGNGKTETAEPAKPDNIDLKNDARLLPGTAQDGTAQDGTAQDGTTQDGTAVFPLSSKSKVGPVYVLSSSK